MISYLKKIIKKSVEKNGFRVIKETEYLETIEGIEAMYATSLFKEMPLQKRNRISLISKLLGTGVHEAFFILGYLNKARNIPGDVCEFGIAQGATSTLLANEILDTNKNLWLFDSFEGLPAPTKKDNLKDDIFNLGDMKRYEGTMKNPVSSVKQRLHEIKYPLSKVKIVPGFVEKTLKYSNLPKEVCFAYLDFDFYEPTIQTLIFLDSRINKGGFILVDDYDFFSTGIKTAISEFMKENGKKYELILPPKSAGHFCILKKIK